MNRRLLTLATVLSAAFASFGTPAHAQGDKTVRILVGFPPGGSIDIVARVLAEKLREELKTTVIVDNRAGAGGRIAAELLKSAPADGSTLMITPVVVVRERSSVRSMRSASVKSFVPEPSAIGWICRT